MNNQTSQISNTKIDFGDLAKAWFVLVFLTLAGFALSYLEEGWLSKIGPLIIAALILAKSRLILTRYLGLTRSPAWLSMLSSIIFIIMVVSAGLLVFV